MYRVLLVLLILELKFIFRTSSKFVDTHITGCMGHETFSILCDGPWNFVEEFKMGHQNFGKIYNFLLRPTLAVTLTAFRVIFFALFENFEV